MSDIAYAQPCGEHDAASVEPGSRGSSGADGRGRARRRACLSAIGLLSACVLVAFFAHLPTHSPIRKPGHAVSVIPGAAFASAAFDVQGVESKLLVSSEAALQWTDWAGRCLTVYAPLTIGSRVLLTKCKEGAPAAEQSFVEHHGMLEMAINRSLCVTMGAKSGESFPLVMYPCDYHNRGQFFQKKGSSPHDPLKPQDLDDLCVSADTVGDYVQAMAMSCLDDAALDGKDVLQSKRRLRTASASGRL